MLLDLGAHCHAADVQQKAWLNTDHHFAPGKELFRSGCRFRVWAYTLSHSQLLLRAAKTPTDRDQQWRIDILFKPIAAIKTRMSYGGLVLRCATIEEHERILRETGLPAHSDSRVFIIEAAETIDYVVAQAVGWQEDDQEEHDPSALAFFMGATDPTRLLPSNQRLAPLVCRLAFRHCQAPDQARDLACVTFGVSGIAWSKSCPA